jgi:hypothetical protein
MPTPQPPRIGFGKNRPGFTPPRPQPEAQVEVEKFDPATLVRPPVRPPMSEKDLEPLDLKKPIPTEAPPPKPAEPAVAPPEPMPDILEKMVPDSLISKLEARFGIQPEKFHEAVIEAMGQTLDVSFRIPAYDDYIWAMAVVERKLLNQEDASLLQTDAQRTNMMTHLVDCRAIVKIDGQWLWQVFNREAEIRTVVPSWDGQAWDVIPDFIRGTMATAVYELFRKRLHADLLFSLEKVVKEAEEAASSKEKEDEDPSSAA